MTTFDEEALKKALRDAADHFVINDEAKERILGEARLAPDVERVSKVRLLSRHYGKARTSLMAAAACIVALGIAVPLLNTEGSAPRFGALAPTRGVADAHGSTVVINGTGFQGTSSPTDNLSFGDNDAAGTVALTSAKVSQSSLRVEEVGTVDLSVGSKAFETTLTRLTDFATTDGGFVSSTQAHMGTKANGSFSSGSIVLQVPESRFTMLVDQVRHAGLATSVKTSATDVTGQYVDLQARISALEVSRSQYLTIMTRTDSIGGILSVQSQLNSIQSQIEQLQGQLNLLNKETTYASLTVTLSEAGHPVVTPALAPMGLDKAWHESVRGFVVGVEWVIRIAGPLLFTALLLAALLVLGRLIWRATDRRRNPID